MKIASNARGTGQENLEMFLKEIKFNNAAQAHLQ